MTIDNMVQYDENRMPSDKHFLDQHDDDGEVPDTLEGMGAA